MDDDKEQLCVPVQVNRKVCNWRDLREESVWSEKTKALNCDDNSPPRFMCFVCASSSFCRHTWCSTQRCLIVGMELKIHSPKHVNDANRFWWSNYRPWIWNRVRVTFCFGAAAFVVALRRCSSEVPIVRVPADRVLPGEQTGKEVDLEEEFWVAKESLKERNLLVNL